MVLKFFSLPLLFSSSFPPLSLNSSFFLLFLLVISSLFPVVQVSLQFDPAVVLMSWKSLGKLVCHVKDRPRLLGNGCHGYRDIVRELCNAMLVKGREAVEATTGGVSHCSSNFSFFKT